MSEKPILFSGPMVARIIACLKHQTRRPVRVQPQLKGGAWYWKTGKAHDHYHHTDKASLQRLMVPYARYQVGDRMWVKETHRLSALFGIGENEDDQLAAPGSGVCVEYKDGTSVNENEPDWRDVAKHERWRPSIFMHRWSSRITLEVTAVRAQQAQDISTFDVLEEGYEQTTEDCAEELGRLVSSWNELYKANPDLQWEANPWLFAYTFQRVNE